MRKPVADEPVEEDSSSSEEEMKPEEIKYVIQEYDSKINFRTLDHVHNFIFLKNNFLVSLIFSIIFLVSISFSSVLIFVLYFLLQISDLIYPSFVVP